MAIVVPYNAAFHGKFYCQIPKAQGIVPEALVMPSSNGTFPTLFDVDQEDDSDLLEGSGDHEPPMNSSYITLKPPTDEEEGSGNMKSSIFIDVIVETIFICGKYLLVLFFFLEHLLQTTSQSNS